MNRHLGGDQELARCLEEALLALEDAGDALYETWKFVSEAEYNYLDERNMELALIRHDLEEFYAAL